MPTTLILFYIDVPFYDHIMQRSGLQNGAYTASSFQSVYAMTVVDTQ